MAAHLPDAEIRREEPLKVQGFDAMEICRPDTPSTVSEAASEVQSTAPVLDYPNNVNVEEQQQPLNTPDNPPQVPLSLFSHTLTITLFSHFHLTLVCSVLRKECVFRL